MARAKTTTKRPAKRQWLEIEIVEMGKINGRVTLGNGSAGIGACLPLVLIRHAWHEGCDFEDLADGFGLGLGTMGDWSAIRDSSTPQVSAMLCRALNYLGIE